LARSLRLYQICSSGRTMTFDSFHRSNASVPHVCRFQFKLVTSCCLSAKTPCAWRCCSRQPRSDDTTGKCDSCTTGRARWEQCASATTSSCGLPGIHASVWATPKFAAAAGDTSSSGWAIWRRPWHNQWCRPCSPNPSIYTRCYLSQRREDNAATIFQLQTSRWHDRTALSA
jgi:hypothetical protein